MTKLTSILTAVSLIISGFATLVLGNYIVFAFAMYTNPDWDGVYATGGNITFTGNVSNNESVNITRWGTTVQFCFHTGGNPLRDGCQNVSLSSLQNYSDRAYSNLTSVINNDATVSNWIVASNGSSNSTVIRARTIGRIWNDVQFQESVTNAVFAQSSLTGGKDVVAGQSSTLSYASIVFPLMGLLMMVSGFVLLLITVKGFSIISAGDAKLEDITGTGKSDKSDSGSDRSTGFNERG